MIEVWRLVWWGMSGLVFELGKFEEGVSAGEFGFDFM